MADLSSDGPKQHRLPAVVVVEREGLDGSVVVAGPVAGQPGTEHGWPVRRVPVDEVGGMAGQGEWLVGVAEARHQVRGAVEDHQNGPREALRVPAAVQLVGEVERLGVQPVGEREADVGHHAVAVARGAQVGSQFCSQPVPDSDVGHNHQVGFERILGHLVQPGSQRL